MFWRKRQRVDDEERQPLLTSAAALLEDETPQQHSDLLPKLGAAYGALSAQKMPSTSQLASVIRALLGSDLLMVTEPDLMTPSRLSAAGRQVLLDTRQLLHAVLVLLIAKNGEDQLQEFIFHTKRAEPTVKPKVDVPNVDVPAPTVEEVEDEAVALAQSVRTLAVTLASNVLSTSNSLLQDVFVLFRTVLADSADEVADRAHGAAAALRPADRSEETDVPAKTGDVLEKEVEALKETVGETAAALSAASEQTTNDPERFKRVAANDTRGVMLHRIEMLIERLRTDHDSGSALLTALEVVGHWLDEVDELASAAKEVVTETDVSAEVQDPHKHATLATQALQKLIEAFAGQSLDPLRQAGQRFREHVRTDDQLSSSLHDVRSLLDDTIKQGLDSDPKELMSRAEQIYDRLVELAEHDPEWRNDWNDLRSQLDSLWSGLTHDEELAAVRDALAALTRHFLGLTKQTFLTLEGEAGDLWRDVVNIMLPRILTYLKHLSVPRTEVSTPFIDVVVDDLRLADVVLLPTFVQATQRADIIYDRRPGSTGEFHLGPTTGTLQLSGLSFSCAGVSLAMSRKFLRWLPYMRRFSSLAEVQLPLPGIRAVLSYTRLGASWSEGTSFTRLDSLIIEMATLVIRLRKSSHPVFTFLLSRLISPFVRLILAMVVQQQLRQAYKAADEKLFEVAKAAEERGGTITDWAAAAFAAVQSSGQAEGDDEDAQPEEPADESRPLLAGVHATRVGIVKDDPETNIAVAIGAGPQLVDGDVQGPGYDSIRDVVKDAQRATPDVPTSVTEARTRIEKTAGQVQRGKAQGQKMAQKESDTWRSQAFDIV